MNKKKESTYRENTICKFHFLPACNINLGNMSFLTKTGLCSFRMKQMLQYSSRRHTVLKHRDISLTN